VVCYNITFHFNSVSFYVFHILHVFYIIPSLNILRIIHDINFNPSLVVLQTKGKFSCPVCGRKMKSLSLRSLGNEVFDEYIDFLSKNHRY
jgi:hypothetical protein